MVRALLHQEQPRACGSRIPPKVGLQAATGINLADARDEPCLHLWSGIERELSVPLELPRRLDTGLAIKHGAWSVTEEKIRNRRQE